MDSQKTKRNMLTALGCAGSMAAMLMVTSPAVAAATVEADDALLLATEADSNPITDAVKCGCARCTLGEVTPSF